MRMLHGQDLGRCWLQLRSSKLLLSQAAVQNDSASERIVNGTIRQQEKKRSAEVGACGGG